MSAPGERYGHMGLQLKQIASLTHALKLCLEEETRQPLESDMIGALAIAIERATEDTTALFSAYYHPISGDIAKDPSGGG